jgi:Tol biopolymer transport system component/DNA-binding winged helix-turn-helix (wHTH) protein
MGEHPPIALGKGTSSGQVHFGVFEVDLSAGELRKSGMKIRLQHQPFAVLAILLERPGEVVTREELQQRLWASDTTVDFENGLNRTINRLREALDDNAENPRFIETLHRRGYRFVAPVEGPRAQVVTRNEQAVAEPGPPAPTAPVEPKKLPRWRRWAGIAALVVAAALLGFWLRPQLPPPRVLATQELTDDGLPKDSLVTDENRIYFTERPPGRVVIAEVSSRGGEVSSIDAPITNPHVEAVSPEQSELLARQKGGPYWIVPLPTGSPRRLNDAFGGPAVWAPNGKLVFAKDKDLYIAEHDGASPRKLATAPDFPDNISFSPDGSRFRFTATNLANDTSAIWEARADGSDMRPVFLGWNNPPTECYGHWTPDGKYFVFQSTRGGATNLWIVRERSAWWRKVSHQPVQLTVGPLQFSSPLPSADGKKLFAVGTRRRAELVRYDAKSGEFVPYMGGISAGDLDFSRDGQWVTYVSYPERTLWRSKLDGSARLQLTFPPVHALLPRWSPDGQHIAFSGKMPGKPWKVLLITKDGGSPQKITDDELEELDPTWSADGKRLAFGHSSFLNDTSSRIALLDLETHQISELPDSQKICCPRWSPDGRFIVAITGDPLLDQLMLYDVKNQRWRELHTDTRPFTIGYVAWSRDNTYVYFDLNASGDSRYFRLRISDSKLEQPVDVKRLRQFPDEFGMATESWIGLGPSDTPLFVRDISTQEIYALDVDLP